MTMIEPGWYPDPWYPRGLRYWDGRQWTTYVGRRTRLPHPTLPLAVAIGALVALAVPIVSSRFLLRALSDANWPIAAYVTLAAVVGYGPAMAWCWYAGRRWGSGGFRRSVGLSAQWSDLGWGPVTWLACLGAQVVVGIVVVALGIPFASNTDAVSDLRSDRGYVLSLLVLAVVIAPIVEEIVFRGVVMRGLLSVCHPVLAVGLQAVLFGTAHFDPIRGIGNIGLVMVLSAVGAVLGGAAYLLRRIAPTMIAHAILNGLALALVLSG